MAPKKAGNSNLDKNVKKRNVISLSIKLNILDRFKKGESLSYISRALDLPTSTIGTIRDNKDKILASALAGTSLNHATVSRIRSKTMERMERLLSLWIEDQSKKNIPICLSIICEKALSLYECVKKEEGENWKEESFFASRGWFDKFRKRYNLHNIKTSGEAASADVDSAKAFPEELKKLIEEGNYSAQQVFNVDETGLFWKRMPERTYISKDEKSAAGHKQYKDRLSLLLGGNAAGDMKLKPLLVYTSLNPRSMRDINKDHLPVIWRKSKKSWLNSTIFTDWFSNYFCPAIKRYCQRSNISHKALLLMDNAPCHPPNLSTLSAQVKVIFLPKNTTSLIQPMDQGVIAAFKNYYLRRTFRQLFHGTDGENNPTVKEWWSSYNIYKAVLNIGESWEEVNQTTMNGVWKNIWPECTNNFQGFDNIERGAVVDLSQIRRDILETAHNVGFTELVDSDLLSVLNAQSEPLTNDELLELDANSEGEENEVPAASKHLTAKCLAEALMHIDAAMDIFTENDPNMERSLKVSRGVYQQITCYKEIYASKKAAKQKSIQDYLRSGETSNSLPENSEENSEPTRSNLSSQAEEKENENIEVSLIDSDIEIS